MNDQLVQCDERRLTELLAGENDRQQSEWIEHVEHCPHCQRRLRELAADEVDWRKASEGVALSDSNEGHRSAQGNACSTTWNESMVSQLLAPPSHPEMLGRLGRYEIERLIGSGGMGIVFKAFDSELNRPVAVKILAPYLASSEPARKRFAREARSAAGIVDDHVIPIFNVESEGEPPFLVMKYIAGGSLQEKLDRDGPLELTEILRIGLQSAKGLTAAHAQGLIHRDVKPSNIMLDEGVERALITDFGLARAEHEVSLTNTGFHPGTPHYMSPEQVRGESIDARSDLFSLGCVLYALCTGRPPFQAATSYAILRKITDDEPQPVSELNPDLPEWLGRVVMKLLSKSSSDRFTSSSEVAELLERCLAHVHQPDDVALPESLRKPSPGLWQRVASRGTLAIASFAILSMAGLIAATGDGEDENTTSAIAQTETANEAIEESPATPATDEKPKSTKPSGDAARREFIDLVSQLDRQFEVVPPGKSGIGHIKMDADNVAVHVEALFLFEEANRGTHLGLMALRKLVTDSIMKTTVAGKTSPKQRAMQRLVHYADRPILSEILFHAVNGDSDRTTEAALRAIIASPQVSRFVRPSAELNLATWMLQFEHFVLRREQVRQQMDDLADDESPSGMATLNFLKRQLAAAPDPKTFAKWQSEAIATLEHLRDTATDIRPPGVRPAGNRNVLRISHELTRENPTISEMATRKLPARGTAPDNVTSNVTSNAIEEATEAAPKQEFIQLVETFDRHFEKRTSELTTPLADEETTARFLTEGILPVELESLLLFEERHRGEHFGLLSLRYIIAHAKRYGLPPTDVRSANARAIKRLEHYTSQPMLTHVLMLVAGSASGVSGFVERDTEDALRAVLNSPKLSDSVRPVAQLALCNWMLSFEGFVTNRAMIEEQIEQTKQGTAPDSKHQAKTLENLLAASPSKEVFQTWKTEAFELLENLEKTATEVRLPAIRVDGHRAVLRINAKATRMNETISEVAARIRRERQTQPNAARSDN